MAATPKLTNTTACFLIGAATREKNAPTFWNMEIPLYGLELLRKTFEHRHDVASDEANRKQAEQIACYLDVIGGAHLATKPVRNPKNNEKTQATMKIKSGTLASVGRMTFIAHHSPSN